jgi:hypothetical protein
MFDPCQFVTVQLQESHREARWPELELSAPVMRVLRIPANCLPALHPHAGAAATSLRGLETRDCVRKGRSGPPDGFRVQPLSVCEAARVIEFRPSRPFSDSL